MLPVRVNTTFKFRKFWQVRAYIRLSKPVWRQLWLKPGHTIFRPLQCPRILSLATSYTPGKYSCWQYLNERCASSLVLPPCQFIASLCKRSSSTQGEFHFERTKFTKRSNLKFDCHSTGLRVQLENHCMLAVCRNAVIESVFAFCCSSFWEPSAMRVYYFVMCNTTFFLSQARDVHFFVQSLVWLHLVHIYWPVPTSWCVKSIRTCVTVNSLYLYIVLFIAVISSMSS